MARWSNPSPYGTHRVVEPAGVLPQAAWKLDATVELADNEIAVDVRTLNIDSASFTQIKAEVGAQPEAIAAKVREIVATRGKMHNPATGSGGMLIGTVSAVGSALAGKVDFAPGDHMPTGFGMQGPPLVLGGSGVKRHGPNGLIFTIGIQSAIVADSSSWQ